MAVRPQFETAEQISNQVPQLNTGLQGNTAVFNDENIVGSSDDLGQQWVLSESSKPREITASVDLAGYHTSNVALTSNDAVSDQYFVGQLSLSWQRAVTDRVSFDIGVQQAFFRYNQFTELNFDSLNLGAGLTGQLPNLRNATWYARYNFNRLTAENFGSELYHSHSLVVGAQTVFQLSRADSFFVGVIAQINFTDPSDLERREYGVYAGYALVVTRSLIADAIYRAALYDYSDRLDLNQTLSIALRWKPVDYLTVSAVASGTINRSDNSTFDYNLFNTGASITVGYQF